jgi:hypothetical protein
VQKAPPFDLTKFSVDDIYYGIRKRLSEIDEANRAIMKEMGPLSFEGDFHFGPIPPYIPKEIPVAPRLAYGLLNTFLEVLRLLTTFGPLESGFLRMIMSIATGIFEIARGEWRDGVLSFMGVFSSFMVYAGTIGKTFRLVYGFINPQLQNQLEDTLFASGKSLFIGIWLWALSISAPAHVRKRLEDLRVTVMTAVNDLNGKMGEIEAAAKKRVEGLGIDISFGRIDPGKIPSFDDVQNLTIFLNMPEIICLDVTKKVLEPLMKIPVTRLLVELLGVPVSDEALNKKCAGQATSAVELVQSTLGPQIVSSKGGSKLWSKRRTRRRKRANRRTRKN